MFLPIIIIGWLFVVFLIAVAEAVDPKGSLLSAFFTFFGWGVFPLSIVAYILATPMRRRWRQSQEAPDKTAAHTGQASKEEGSA